MRATVRAASITTRRRTRAGVAVTRTGALAFSVAVAALAGAFFAGPAIADGHSPVAPMDNHVTVVPVDHRDDDNDKPPGCPDEVPIPVPPCGGDPEPTDPEPTEPEPEPTEPDDPEEPTSEPSNVVTKPGGGGNGGGNGNDGDSGSGGSEPQLPVTGAEVGVLAATGAALVGGGAALMVASRRRKAAVASGDEAAVAGDDTADEESKG